MRVSPIGWVFDTMEETLDEAALSAEATHNHPEGIKGAQATAAAVFVARTGSSKQEIKEYIASRFGYHLEEDIDYLREYYEYNETCQRTVPESIAVFLASTDFEDAIRMAVSIGGDSDTIACIVGGIAEAFYGKVPERIRNNAFQRLDARLRGVVEEFRGRFMMDEF
jgi:ADP-ribosylglycohydrolase